MPRVHALLSSVAQGSGGATEAVGRAGAAADRERPEAAQAASAGCHRALPKSTFTSLSETQAMLVMRLT